MTGKIFAIKRFEIHDGDGIRTTVFLQGCPLCCKWCHNPEGLEQRPVLAFRENRCVSCGRCAACCTAHQFVNGVHTIDRSKCTHCGKCVEVCSHKALTLYGKEITVEELMPALLEDELFYRASGGGVTLSGGEPMLQADFAMELLKALRDKNIHTALDTCGFASPEDYRRVLPYTCQFLFDVKAIQADVHKRLTGQPNQMILENLRMLSDNGANIEVRVPYIPGMNDGEMAAIADFLASCKQIKAVKILGYHDLAKDKYQAVNMDYPGKEIIVPSPMEKETVEELFRSRQLNVVRL